MPEMHLKDIEFTCSACRPHIYHNKLDKACCHQHDMAYGDFKNFPKRTASDKLLYDKSFNTTQASETWRMSKGSGFNGLQIVLWKVFKVVVVVLKVKLMSN